MAIQECPACDGTGVLIHPATRQTVVCPTCGGYAVRRVVVVVPQEIGKGGYQ